MVLSIFVYGTLKPGECNYDRYCGEWVCSAQPAIVPGRLYHLSLGYPGLTAESGWVQGILLHFSNPEVLVAIDELEGFDPQNSTSDHEYQREWEQIYHLDRSPLGWAWIYRMALPKIQQFQGIWIPEGIWSEDWASDQSLS